MITLISPQKLVQQIKKNIQHLQSDYGLLLFLYAFLRKEAPSFLPFGFVLNSAVMFLAFDLNQINVDLICFFQNVEAGS
jgi:hypothetical protein